MNIIIFLLPAFIACIILTGIHTYLGIHVIHRGVIFVDIALAQIAALGMTVALHYGFEPQSSATYFFALGATSLGALFFAYFRDEKISQEVIIGVSFAVSSAMGILISDRLPHGSEHLKQILSGDILWVTWPQLQKTAIIYAILGIFHFLIRHNLWLVSIGPDRARAKGLRLWVWDLIFYLSFGLVITSSVQMAGILQVFAFLIVPACCSILFFEDLKSRLLFGWILGVLCSVAGIGVSYFWDLPTGPAIVSVFGAVFFIALLFKRNRISQISRT